MKNVIMNNSLKFKKEINNCYQIIVYRNYVGNKPKMIAMFHLDFTRNMKKRLYINSSQILRK